ncbi:MAG: hypothetical protein HKL95_01995 [Phycisphaerae bacterium]|nr:hypothetical protein [Phycisphaerae bacterium]
MNIIYIILLIVLFLFWVLMLVDALKISDGQKGLWMAIIVVPLLIAAAFLFLVPAWNYWAPLIIMDLGAFAYNFIKRGK